MKDADRIKLLYGPYRTPRCRIGKKLFCEIKGWVPVTRMSAGRIPWPITTAPRGRGAFMLCGDLVKAVRRESNLAVCHWWGVTAQTVSKWRKALGVGLATEGTLRLHARWFPELISEADRQLAVKRASSPEANAKKAAAVRSREMSPKARAALARSWGQRPSTETRRRMSETHKRLGTRPRPEQPLWNPGDDALLGTIPDAELAAKLGRTRRAVASRRVVLRIPAFVPPGKRRKGTAMKQRIVQQKDVNGEKPLEQGRKPRRS